MLKYNQENELKMNTPIRLSFVVTARNDDHGKNFLYRMQHFVNGVIEQSNRHELRSELIVVEWNPPEDKKLLSEVITLPENNQYCDVRYITVPNSVHRKFENSDRIPLFQMIGKNVGIRRAKGEFVLATNIDILFSDEIFEYMKNSLKKGVLYRATRYDVPEKLPENASFQEILNFCSENFFRINAKWGSLTKVGNKWIKFNKIPIKERLKRFIEEKWRILFNFVPLLLKKIIKFLNKKHTNACGDFTLLSLDDWKKLKGYKELPIYSWHIDSILLYQAHEYSIREIDLSDKYKIYHIDHSLSSGYTHESPDALFDRLKKLNISFLSDDDLDRYFENSLRKQNLIRNISDSWGLKSTTLN